MKPDWQVIRKPLTILLISLATSVLVLTFAVRYNNGEFKSFSAIEKEFHQTKRRYTEARRDKELYRQYMDSYLEYIRKGVIGQEQRLSWIEVLQAINKELKLPMLRYEISPQAKADLPQIVLPNKIRINVSEMRLEAGLLHEGDMINMLNMLRDRANGLYEPQSCKITSRMAGGRIVRFQPGVQYLDIECTLNWYTVEVES